MKNSEFKHDERACFTCRFAVFGIAGYKDGEQTLLPKIGCTDESKGAHILASSNFAFGPCKRGNHYQSRHRKVA